MEKEMRDSGIPWLGEIPKSWRLSKIKYVLNERKEKNNPIRCRDILSLTAKPVSYTHLDVYKRQILTIVT